METQRIGLPKKSVIYSNIPANICLRYNIGTGDMIEKRTSVFVYVSTYPGKILVNLVRTD